MAVLNIIRLLKSPWITYKRLRTPWWIHCRVESHSEGFQIISRVDPYEPRREYKWSAILRVEAYKRDALLIELTCLTFFTACDQCELNHKMGGWKEFIRVFRKALPDHFPETTWFPDESQSMTGSYPISSRGSFGE